MTVVTITKAHGRTEFKSRYDAGVVDIIKTVVPYQHRDFDRTTRIWTVENLYVDDLVKALGAAGHFVGDSDIPPQPKAFWNTESPGGRLLPPDDYAVAKATEILKDIPPDQQGAVFRAMARILYPDMYGRKA